MGVESIATEHSMHYVWWLGVCVCVRACFMLMLVCGGFSDRTNRPHFAVCFNMQNDSKSTDRIFQLHGVPALLAPANLLYRFDCNEWHTSQSINYEWMNLFPNVQMILWKLRFDSFFPNLSFIIVSVLIYLLIDFGLFYLLVSTWVDIFPNIIVWTKHG